MKSRKKYDESGDDDDFEDDFEEPPPKKRVATAKKTTSKKPKKPKSPSSLPRVWINLGVGTVLASILSWHFGRFGSTLSNREEFALVFPFVLLTTVLIISVGRDDSSW